MLGQKLCDCNQSPEDKPCDLIDTFQVDYSRMHGAPALLLGASCIVRIVTPSMKSLKRTFLGPGVSVFIPIRVQRILLVTGSDMSLNLVHPYGIAQLESAQQVCNLCPQIAVDHTAKHAE